MRFLVDAQLPPRLAQWLREQAVEAEHVQDVGLRDAPDHVVWAHALHGDLVILTKDEDFAARSLHAAHAPRVVWLRIGNSTNRALLQWLEPRWDSVRRLLEEGQRLIEVV